MWIRDDRRILKNPRMLDLDGRTYQEIAAWTERDEAIDLGLRLETERGWKFVVTMEKNRYYTWISFPGGTK